MLGNLEVTKFKTIFTTDDGRQLEVKCTKEPDAAWSLLIESSVDIYLHDKAQVISELLAKLRAKDEVDAISYSDYDTKFTLSGKLTTEQVLVEMAKKN